MSDHDLVLTIQEMLDGAEWSADTLDAIANLLILSGYRLRDLEGRDLEITNADTP